MAMEIVSYNVITTARKNDAGKWVYVSTAEGVAQDPDGATPFLRQPAQVRCADEFDPTMTMQACMDACLALLKAQVNPV